MQTSSTVLSLIPLILLFFLFLILLRNVLLAAVQSLALSGDDCFHYLISSSLSLTYNLMLMLKLSIQIANFLFFFRKKDFR